MKGEKYEESKISSRNEGEEVENANLIIIKQLLNSILKRIDLNNYNTSKDIYIKKNGKIVYTINEFISSVHNYTALKIDEEVEKKIKSLQVSIPSSPSASHSSIAAVSSSCLNMQKNADEKKINETYKNSVSNSHSNGKINNHNYGYSRNNYHRNKYDNNSKYRNNYNDKKNFNQRQYYASSNSRRASHREMSTGKSEKYLSKTLDAMNEGKKVKDLIVDDSDAQNEFLWQNEEDDEDIFGDVELKEFDLNAALEELKIQENRSNDKNNNNNNNNYSYYSKSGSNTKSRNSFINSKYSTNTFNNYSEIMYKNSFDYKKYYNNNNNSNKKNHFVDNSSKASSSSSSSKFHEDIDAKKKDLSHPKINDKDLISNKNSIDIDNNYNTNINDAKSNAMSYSKNCYYQKNSIMSKKRNLYNKLSERNRINGVNSMLMLNQPNLVNNYTLKSSTSSSLEKESSNNVEIPAMIDSLQVLFAKNLKKKKQ